MPGHSISRPLIWCFSITALIASAAAICSGMPELWPSPWPGAPGNDRLDLGIAGNLRDAAQIILVAAQRDQPCDDMIRRPGFRAE